MGNEQIALRKEAIRRWLSGESKASIARNLGKSRMWVIRWIGRYQPEDPEGSLGNQSSRPKKPCRDWPDNVRTMVLASRKAREESRMPGYEYALINAEAIRNELLELEVDPVPSVRTIHAWIKQAGFIKKRIAEKRHRTKRYPAPDSSESNGVHQIDLKGPFYLQGSSQKHYLVALRDVCSKRVALAAIQNMQMETVIDFMILAWNKLGLPKVLQMDNGLVFRGSNRYPRSPGKLARVCLDLGVEPLFIPPFEPWRNGVIENLNRLLNRLFFQREKFQNFDHLQSCVAKLEWMINETHRLKALHGLTPTEFVQSSTFRYPPVIYDWRKRNLQLVKNNVSFIRLVRKSGRITLCGGDKFEIGSEYQWQYVLASVNVQDHRLDIFLNGQLIKSFDDY